MSSCVFFDISYSIGHVYFPSLFPVNMYFNRHTGIIEFFIIEVPIYKKFSDIDIMELALGINAKIILQAMCD